tara:strand:+ start:46 stop:405 length:360 start_codon:yes stop_codon:yes gene_type:complete
MSNQVNRVITRQYTVAAVAGGTVLDNILGGESHRGYIRQIIVRASSGGGAKIDVIELRLVAGSNLAEHLVYQNINAVYTLLDAVLAPFDTYTGDGDMQLYLKPNQDGTLVVRIDFEILE